MGYTNVTVDTRITTHAALLHGVVVKLDAAGGHAIVYAGQDANGRKIGSFSGPNGVSTPFYFCPPLLCENGIYVGSFDHVDEILILWSPK